MQMQGYPGGAQPGYSQPVYPQHPGQPGPGYQAAAQYPAGGYGAQPVTVYGQPGQPGVVYGPAATAQPVIQPSYAIDAQQQPHPPVRPEDVEFQLPPDGKQAVYSFNTV